MSNDAFAQFELLVATVLNTDFVLIFTQSLRLTFLASIPLVILCILLFPYVRGIIALLHDCIKIVVPKVEALWRPERLVMNNEEARLRLLELLGQTVR